MHSYASVDFFVDNAARVGYNVVRKYSGKPVRNLEEKSKGCLSANALKIIALIAMTLDHICRILLPQYELLIIIGRISFPIFAYMIAEGCRYTRNKRAYVLKIFAVALLCQTVIWVASRSLFQCVMVTFLLSVLLIYGVQNAEKRKTNASVALAGLMFCTVVFVGVILPEILDGFRVDYGIFGILLPAFVCVTNGKRRKLGAAALGVLGICLTIGRAVQWFSLLSLVLLALYNSKSGKPRLKNFFYIYYPLHIGVIYVISYLIK